jgi:hypothetical protein
MKLIEIKITLPTIQIIPITIYVPTWCPLPGKVEVKSNVWFKS